MRLYFASSPFNFACVNCSWTNAGDARAAWRPFVAPFSWQFVARTPEHLPGNYIHATDSCPTRIIAVTISNPCKCNATPNQFILHSTLWYYFITLNIVSKGYNSSTQPTSSPQHRMNSGNEIENQVLCVNATTSQHMDEIPSEMLALSCVVICMGATRGSQYPAGDNVHVTSEPPPHASLGIPHSSIQYLCHSAAVWTRVA